MPREPTDWLTEPRVRCPGWKGAALAVWFMLKLPIFWAWFSWVDCCGVLFWGCLQLPSKLRDALRPWPELPRRWKSD